MIKKPRPSASPKPVLREKILQALLAAVPFDGWTETAYAAALKQNGVTRAEANKFFPQGLHGCIEFFGEQTDAALQQRITSNKSFARMRVRDKITFAVRARFEILAPHREAVRRLMVWHAMPPHITMGMKRFYKTVDLFWIAAGDDSTDYNFYTKRILLAGVLKTTLLFWLSDDSAGHTATWDFLDRRIGDVMKLGKSISLLKEFEPSELINLARDKIRKFI